MPAHIFECGQCFRWNRVPDTENTYVGIASGRVLAVSACVKNGENVITLANTDEALFRGFWKDYFDLERDYAEIQKELSRKDGYLGAAVGYGRGIRILKQEPFETLISFIISANNNIPRIKGCIEKLCAAYGKRICAEDAFVSYIARISGADKSSVCGEYHAFPSPEELSAATKHDISACCRAGYRCEYIEKTSRAYKDSPMDTCKIKTASADDARKMLRAYTGVGPKVADCVLLFSGLRTDVFPVDVWVRRVLEKLYFKRKVTAAEAGAFVSGHFGELAGYAQQYLFYGMREDPSVFDSMSGQSN